MYRIPFLDLRPQPWLRQLLDRAYQRVMDSGRYVGGQEVEAFEAEWAAYCEAEYCVACGNGFDAIQLALRALELEHIDTVAVSPLTCVPTWQAVRLAGHSPVPLDGRDKNHTISVIVHLYGMINRVPDAPVGRWIIEDCAQAHGSRYFGHPAGKQGDVACWSFYPTKNLGCYGDGGAITTNNSWIAGNARRLRNYGDRQKGINSRLDPLQAAFLRVKLHYLDQWNELRRQNAVQYSLYLSGCPGITIPEAPEGCLPNWHQYAIRTERRDELKAFLEEKGIETMIHYPDHPYHQIYGQSLPIADDWCAHTLSLPIAPPLSEQEIRYVAERILEFHDHRN